MKTVLLLLMALPGMANLSATEFSADKVIKKITSMPPYLVHEDTVESFRSILKKGKFWIDKEMEIAYLFIKGDGIWGQRLFILHADGKLYMIEYTHLEREEDEFNIKVYNEKEKRMDFIGEFEELLFKR